MYKFESNEKPLTLVKYLIDVKCVVLITSVFSQQNKYDIINNLISKWYTFPFFFNVKY